MTLINKLQAAIQYVNDTFILGSANRIDDYERSNGWVLEAWKRDHQMAFYRPDIRFLHVNSSAPWVLENNFQRYSRKSMVPRDLNRDPLAQNPLIAFNNPLLHLIHSAIVSKHDRVGNCLDKAYLFAYYLWQSKNKDIKRIEVVTMKTNDMDHVIVIINRKKGSLLAEPNDWDAQIVDLWVDNGIIYHSDNYNIGMKHTLSFYFKQLNAFFLEGVQFYNPLSYISKLLKYGSNALLSVIGLSSLSYQWFGNTFCYDFVPQLIVEIDTASIPYPDDNVSYIALDDFYEISAQTYTSIFDKERQKEARDEIIALRGAHQEAFSPCLDSIKRLPF